jgi:GT2 family glycosyltransferase
LDSLMKTKYQNYKIYIADTGSSEDNLGTLETYAELIGATLIKYDYYHFAKINNDVVKNHIDSDTEVLLFCNDDIEMVNDAISLMIEEYLKNKKTVGTIGCRLYYGDNTVQHGGVICYTTKENRMGFSHRGIRTIFGASFEKDEDILANTGAFLMIKKALFNGIGGFDERPKECFEDVLLNIDCILRNYKNIYLGEAVCYHYESITRKKNPNKVQGEIQDANDFLSPKIAKHMNRLKKYIAKV